MDDAVRMRKYITEVLPQDIEGERNALRLGGAQTIKVLPGDHQAFAEWDNGVKYVVNDMLDGLKYIFTTNYAEAGWFVSPDCYKDNAPDYTVPGFNGFTFCCDCGLNWECGPDGCICVFELHCGPSFCDCENFGCLNGQCGAWPNAIWDPATGTCGCG